MIHAQGLSKYYGEHRALNDVSFTIQTGEIIGFLGLNGAGKTTLLRILSCFLLPTAGTVTIHGHDVFEHAHQVRRLIGYLSDPPPLYRDMTIHEYLEFVAHLKGLSGKKAEDRIAEVEGIVGVTERKNQVIGTLSHGFQQRVGIAQAVVHDPPLLILDEPFIGLDPVQIVEMRDMITRLKGRHTILLSSHILSEIHQTCDRIFVIHQGRLVASAREDELVQRSQGHGTLELEVRGNSADVGAALTKVGGISGQTISGLSPGIVRVRLECQSDVREELSRALVEAGLGLRGLRPSSDELEATFVQLTQPESQPEVRS